MDWEFIASNCVALFAAYVAFVARRDAKYSADSLLALQKRLEVYEHHPIIRMILRMKDGKIRLTINNVSQKVSAADYEIRFILRISAGNNFSADYEHITITGGFLAPNSSKEEELDEINEIASNSIPFLKKYPRDKTHFVLRAIAQISPPHPEAEKVHEEVVAYFAYEAGHVVMLSNNPREEKREARS